jgi:hypothetical protein
MTKGSENAVARPRRIEKQLETMMAVFDGG